jgi:hypothetical protein
MNRLYYWERCALGSNNRFQGGPRFAGSALNLNVGRQTL